jgi:hypothetical protein
MRRIDSVRSFSGGYIAYGVSDAGAAETVPLVEIRAGVTWPKNVNPGYYIIIGKKAEKTPIGKNPLMFLCEGEDALPGRLYQKLLDDAVRMLANVIYAEKGSSSGARGVDKVGCYTDFFDVIGQTNVELSPAPSVNDEEYGAVLVREYVKDGLLELPQYRMTTILSQLRDMTPGCDMVGLYAFHALRFVLAGFTKYNDVPADWSQVKVQQDVKAMGWT